MSNPFAAVEAVEAEIVKTIAAAKAPIVDHSLKALAEAAFLCAQARDSIAEASEHASHETANKVLTIEMMTIAKEVAEILKKGDPGIRVSPKSSEPEPEAPKAETEVRERHGSLADI